MLMWMLGRAWLWLVLNDKTQDRDLLVNAPNKQKGMTLMGFVLVLGILLAAAYMGMKIVPHYMNYFSISDAIDNVVNDPAGSRRSVAAIRSDLKNVLFVNYVEGLKPENLRVLRTGQGKQVILDYYVVEPIAGNLSVSIHFQRTAVIK